MAGHTRRCSTWIAGFTDRHAAYLALLLIPVATIALAWHVRELMLPVYMSNHDPDYAYLFNGISILNLVAPGHIDHPGTSVQIMVALVLKAMYPLSGGKEIATWVLQDPEKHLLLISHVFAAMIAGAVYLAGITVYRLTRSMTSALLTQMPPVVFGVLVQALPRINPEPMLVAVSMLMAVYLAKLALEKEATRNVAYARSLGLLSGLGVATKLTFGPVVLVPLVAFMGWQPRARFVWFTIAAFILATLPLLLTLPVFISYYRFMRWVLNLFLGSGIYGQGPSTVVNADVFIAGLQDILSNQPLYLLIVGVAMVTLAIAFLRHRSGKEKENRKPVVRVLTGLAMMHILMIILFAKHPQHDRYLAVTLGLSGFTLAVACEYLKTWLPLDALIKRATVVMVVGIIGLLAWPAWAQLAAVERVYGERRMWLSGIERAVKEKYSECAQIHRDSSAQEFALFYGLQWSQKSATVREARDTFFKGKRLFTYDPHWNVYFSISEEKVSLERIKREAQCVVLRTPQDLKVL